MYARSVAASAATSASLRGRLAAVYAVHANALRELARPRVASRADAWDAVQDAFVFVLEHPPRDPGDAALLAALETAVRTACGRQARARRDDFDLRVALQKRFPV
jgi:DNA-directed RNA polymerase specialized sigma24 family protein